MAVGDSYTVAEARSFIYATFWSAWSDETTGAEVQIALDPGGYLGPTKIVWDAIDPDDDTEVDVTEAYVSVRHTNGEQASLRGATGFRWRRTGFLSCRLRFPAYMQLKTQDAVTKVVADAFRGKRATGDGSGIWFRKVREVELGINEARNRQDVLAYFEYDEIS